MSRLSRSPSCLRRIHAVDKSLLLFMAVLLAQSVYNLFVPGAAGQATGDIDIVVRTSAAAIFGYFLSANFIQRASSVGQAPAEGQTHILETGSESSPSAGPVARIGFDTGAEPAEPAQPGDIQIQESSAQTGTAPAGCLQIKVATVIGLSSLAALLVLRNLSQWDLLPVQWEAVSATAAQLRDFVSGCVGFLIGCPTESDSQSQSN